VVNIFVSSVVSGEIDSTGAGTKFAVGLKCPLAKMLNNIVKAGKKLKGYIQKWSADAFPFKLSVSFPRCEMKSAELVADAIKLQSEETKRLSLACAPAMLKSSEPTIIFAKLTLKRNMIK